MEYNLTTLQPVLPEIVLLAAALSCTGRKNDEPTLFSDPAGFVRRYRQR